MLLTSNMKQGTTFTITVKRFPKDYLISNNLYKEVVVEEEVKEPDFEEASKLQTEYENDQAKRELEAYARGFDIELKCSRSFANMMKDFKEIYNGKD